MEDQISSPDPSTNAETSRRQYHSCYRHFIQFLTSHFGLLVVVVAYSIGGAFLFILLEQYIELENCQLANLEESLQVENLSETIYSYVTTTTDNITIVYDQVVQYLEDFTNEIYDRKGSLRYSGQDCDTISGWTFSSALLFTITIITGIGYGHITPVTWEGQITCICYALFGMPIFVIFLANISSVLGDMFRFIYSSLMRCMCCCCRNYTHYRSRMLKHGKRTKGYGMKYVGRISNEPSWPEVHVHFNRNLSQISGNEYNENIAAAWDRIENQVPILSVVLVIILITYLGAIMCVQLEGWTIIESVYFCYITLATIGFGDYVPGITSGSIDGLHFLATCVYIFIGLAIIAMCFNVINESAANKIDWVAEKFNSSSGNDHDDESNDSKYVIFDTTNERTSDNKRLDSLHHAKGELETNEIVLTGGEWMSDIPDKI